MNPGVYRPKSDPPPGGNSFITSDFPSLELSSDSSDGEETPQRPAHSGKATRSLMDAESSASFSRDATSVLLPSILYSREQSLPLETRTNVPSPTRDSATLREKLGRLSRHQRKDLLIRTSGPLKTQHNDTTSTAETSRENRLISPEHRSGRGLQSMVEESIIRLKRQAHFADRRHQLQQTNSISLNIYDLIAKDTLVRLPWGCMCEIGKCFNEMNTALHELGTGAYHVGVEINGVEYAFGATSTPGRSGVFSCIPKLSPGYQYRTTIDFGERPLIQKRWVSVRSSNGYSVYKEVEEFMDGRRVIKEMVPEYMGIDYDILRKNCCTFARDACLRLGIKEEEIPSWFGNLAQSGAMTQDVFQPLLSVLSSYEEKTDEPEGDIDDGFEVVASRNAADTKDVVLVIPAKMNQGPQVQSLSMRRTVTWY